MKESLQDIGQGLWLVAKVACVLIPAVALGFFYPQVFYWTAAGLRIIMMLGALGAGLKKD